MTCTGVELKQNRPHE